jgi:hypothetical protein
MFLIAFCHLPSDFCLLVLAISGILSMMGVFWAKIILIDTAKPLNFA